MKSLIARPTPALAWHRSGFTPPDFDLLGPEGVYATFTYLDELHLLARVRTAEGTWTLKHLGLLTPVVTLREEGSATNLATFHPHALRHGKLTFQDGAVFDWAWLEATGPGGAFLDASGKPLVRLHAHPGRGVHDSGELDHAEVDVSQAPAASYRQALLACMGWYLILFDHLKERDAVAAETALRL